jgi:hypothetical protein
MTVITSAWTRGRSQADVVRRQRARERRTTLLVQLVSWLAAHLPRWSKVRSAVLQVAGFAFIDYALWTWRPIAGIAAVGVSLLILEALSERDR